LSENCMAVMGLIMKECSKMRGDRCFCSYTRGAAVDWEFGMHV